MSRPVPDTDLPTFAEQMAAPYLADVEPNDGPFAPPREVEPVTEELWAAVEARLKAERIAAGDCFACGFDDFLLYCPMGGGTVDSDTDICTCCHDHVVGVKVCVSCGTWQNEAER